MAMPKLKSADEFRQLDISGTELSAPTSILLFHSISSTTLLNIMNDVRQDGLDQVCWQRGRFDNATTRFLKWFQTQATGISDKIRISDFRAQGAGRGVVATQDIEDGEELFSIPRSAILLPSTSSLPTDMLANVSSPWHRLILAMIYEFGLGAASKWEPYLNVLPTHFDTLMFWSQEELAMLQGSTVLDKIGRDSADESFQSEIIPVIRSNSQAFNANALDDNALLDLCHRMGSIIMAYAFDIEQFEQDEQNEEDGWEVASDDEAISESLVGLVPMADLLNADADRNNAKLFHEDDKVCMRSIRQIAKGQEILNDYGPLPRADLLRRYGYVTEHYSQYDAVEISQGQFVETLLEHIPELKPEEIDRRFRYLEKRDLTVDAFDIQHATIAVQAIPESLVICLKIMTMNAADYEQERKQPSIGDEKLQTLNQESLTILKSLLIKRRRQYGNRTLAQDLSDLSSVPSSHDASPENTTHYRKRMALQVISGEKQVLHDAYESIIHLHNANDKKRSMADLESEASTHNDSDKRQKAN